MIAVLALVLFIIATALGAFLADANHRADAMERKATALEQENTYLRHYLDTLAVDASTIAAYSCPRCGARMGVAGGGAEAAEMFRADVEWHTTGLCQVQPLPAPRLRAVRGDS